MIWRLTISIILVITGLFTKYLSEVPSGNVLQWRFTKQRC
jgi:hypothetical protein